MTFDPALFLHALMSPAMLGGAAVAMILSVIVFIASFLGWALSQILQVNSMLTMGREVAAPDIAERADDFEYHCRKAEAPVEG